MMESFLYLLLVQASLFALGTALVASVVLAMKRVSYWWAYFGAKLAMFGIVGEILVLVLPKRVAQPSIWTYLYLFFLALFGIMLIFVSRDIIQRAYREDP